ncbi:MAG: hypothetical protein HZB67_03480 [Candidatus Aenigmarchaeota archaeon]|nr:hypothetical protein [Candidatus Aenigmarchaeota archaeon]
MNAQEQTYSICGDLPIYMVGKIGSSRHELLPETKYLLKQAYEISGKPILVSANPSVADYAKVDLAWSGYPAHVISYNPQYEEVRNYLIAHECGHLVRIFSAPSRDRRLLTVKSEGQSSVIDSIPEDIHQCLSNGVYPENLYSIINRLYYSIVSLMANVPADIHIERCLYENCPGLLADQWDTLYRGMMDLQTTITRNSRDSPATLLRKHGTLCYAFAAELDYIFSRNELASSVREFADEKQADDLQEILRGIGDQGHPGDVLTTNEWARYLGIQGWFGWSEWVRYESPFFSAKQ